MLCSGCRVQETASNFSAECTQLSDSSTDSSCCYSESSASDDFAGFDFEAPDVPHIEYGYSRDIGAPGGAGVCA